MLKPPTLIYAFLDSGLQTYFKPHLEYYTSSCNTRRFAAKNRWWTSIVEQPSTQHQTQALRDRQKAHLFRRLSTITMLLCLVLHCHVVNPLADPEGGGGGGGGGGGFRGFELYFYQKLIFFLGACPPTPLLMVCLM